MFPAEAEAANEYGRQRDQYQQAQVQHAEAQRQAEAGQHTAPLALFDCRHPSTSCFVAGPAADESQAWVRRTCLLTVDFIEGTMVCEMGGLCLGPAAECAVNGEQLRNVRKLLGIFGTHRGIARAIKMPRGDLLTLG